MGAWRDDTFLFRQVSAHRHSENKLKINFEPLLALTLLHVWRGGTREHGSYLLEPLIVAAPSALSAILAEVRVKVESSDSLVVS